MAARAAEDRLVLRVQHTEHPHVTYLQDVWTAENYDDPPGSCGAIQTYQPDATGGLDLDWDDELDILQSEAAIVILVNREQAPKLVEAILALEIR